MIKHTHKGEHKGVHPCVHPCKCVYIINVFTHKGEHINNINTLAHSRYRQFLICNKILSNKAVSVVSTDELLTVLLESFVIIYSELIFADFTVSD